jgi:hypothetical protein
MNRSDAEREALEWHLENLALHEAAICDEWEEEENEWECPTCGRRSCAGYCPV